MIATERCIYVMVIMKRLQMKQNSVLNNPLWVDMPLNSFTQINRS